MYRLRTKNEFKLRVMMYHGFTVLSMLFLKIDVCLKPFCSNFNMIFLFVLQERCPKPKCKRLWRYSREVTHEGHQRTVDGDRRLDVQASGSNSGNFDKV